MPKFALQLLAVSLIITSTWMVHAFAKIMVAEGFGLAALVLILGSLPFLRRYID